MSDKYRLNSEEIAKVQEELDAEKARQSELNRVTCSTETVVIPESVSKLVDLMMSDKKVHVSGGRKVGRSWALQIANAKNVNP